MRALVYALLFATITMSSSAVAQVNVSLCDGCTSQQREEKARTAGWNYVYVGDRISGVLYGYNHNFTPIWLGPMQEFVEPVAVSDDMMMEFMAYSDAYKALGGAGVINMPVNLAHANPSTLPPSFPGSAFDIVRDGPARHALVSWLSEVGNWPSAVDRASFYAKLVIQQGRSLYTGAEFTIRITAVFPDGGTAVLDYNSAVQSLTVVEARDSKGHLIYTSSKDPVSVDYTYYERAERGNQRDFDRALQYLQLRGVLTIRTDGSRIIRRGTVITSDLIDVRTTPK